MTVYPLIIHLGPIEITGYGIMVMVAFLFGGWVLALELRRRQLAEDYAADIVAAAVIGAIIGALLSRGGMVWYGGFIGGALAVALNGRRLQVPIRWTMQLIAPVLAVSYAIGRIGCFLVNDDYGRPTNLPWGIKFPHGLPPSTAGNLEFRRVLFRSSTATCSGCSASRCRPAPTPVPCSPSTLRSSTKSPSCSSSSRCSGTCGKRSAPSGGCSAST